MTLNQLTYFCAASRYHSITKAAKALYVTQPTISIAIRELEIEFKITLFSKSGNNLVLTDEGERFYEKASYLLEYADEIHTQFADIGNYKPTVRLGIPPMLSTVFFPDLYNAFTAACSDITLTLTEYGSARACELVQDEVLDAAIVNMEIYNIDKFNSHVIANEQLLFCVSEKHPMAGLKHVTLEQIANEPLILFNADSVQNQLMKLRFNALQIQPNVIMHCSQIHTTLRFLEQNGCGCFFFSCMMPQFEHVRGIPVKPALNAKIGLVWKKGKYINAGMQKFIDFTKDFLKQ